MAVEHVFKALGNPVRLNLVKQLSSGPAHTIGELSADLDISRQGTRKHIQVLESADVVRLKPDGRSTKVVLNTTSLESGRAFIKRLEDQWDQRLQALKEFTES